MKDCNSCGKCCIHYGDGGLSATADEITAWEIFRPEIAEYVSNGEIWFSPITGEALTHCPWLKKTSDSAVYSCDIYADRPADCKHYPVIVEDMLRDECEMLEPRDVTNIKQAQKTLDKIMIDSRPSLMT